MKVICGLGNPGPEYAATRHNVGWWVIDALRARWGFPSFVYHGPGRFSDGHRAGTHVVLVEPLTFMNRSGDVLAPLTGLAGFLVATDLLVVLDDVNLDVGRVRLRPRGSAGGHNGLKSVEHALGTTEYARLRVGVGAAPPGEDLVDWVLSTMSDEDEVTIRALFPSLAECIETWLTDSTEATMQRCNG